ncbi:MAG: adenylate/guanylate cyclase domain-containing protein [Treponemataceae bacterium]|nr:adenylate/guanylate cyclase domain-containing protein [Treponemataceae bacterium]
MNKPVIFQKVGKTSIIPISAKLLLVFIIMMLLSNFSTNYINILLNQRQLVVLTNQLLIRDLKELYSNAGNQYEIYKFSNDLDECVKTMTSGAVKNFSYEHSMVWAVRPGAGILFSAAADGQQYQTFPDVEALAELLTARKEGVTEGSLHFKTEHGDNLAVYKYHEAWDCFFIRSELVQDMNAESARVFAVVSVIIVFLTAFFMVIGYIVFGRILRYVKQMINSLYEMQQSQNLGLLDLSGAPNDDITYLGASFNSLSSTINNLLSIFQRFTTRDVVEQAYKNHYVGLEGNQRNLTILFSDIRGFTYMTETLGNDIINLLNIHYERAIGKIHSEDGIIGSIIGDAILAVYGAVESSSNKSLQALRSAWEITKATAVLRETMIESRREIEASRTLTEAEERIFKAVLIDVGVGIDGGTVFYGNIGSNERMTTTVIGDNVNSASRLEGLTRVYHLPVIVSEYVKDDVLSVTDRYRFYEVDTVQVKGKTEGKKIFFPYDTNEKNEELENKWQIFESALQNYYSGDWAQSRSLMQGCGLELCGVFIERMKNSLPENWSGIWTMTSK